MQALLSSERVITQNELPLLPWSAVDYNRDGAIDAADYVVWRKLNGASGANLPADGNLNGQVNAADYAVWGANYGRGSWSQSGVGATAPNVPEPAAGLLLLAAAISLIAMSRRFPRALLG